MHMPAARPATAWPVSRLHIWTGSLVRMIGSVPRALLATFFRRFRVSGPSRFLSRWHEPLPFTPMFRAGHAMCSCGRIRDAL